MQRQNDINLILKNPHGEDILYHNYHYGCAETPGPGDKTPGPGDNIDCNIQHRCRTSIPKSPSKTKLETKLEHTSHFLPANQLNYTIEKARYLQNVPLLHRV